MVRNGEPRLIKTDRTEEIIELDISKQELDKLKILCVFYYLKIEQHVRII